MSAALIVASTLGSTVERIGAYGGLASMIGLGVLALLYFAQAREVKRLREWAGRAPERAAEIEQRVQVDVQRRVIAQPQTAAAAAQVSGAPAAGLTGEAATRAAAIVAARATHPPAVGSPGQLARPAAGPAAGIGSSAPAADPAAPAVPKPPATALPLGATPQTAAAVGAAAAAGGGADRTAPAPGAAAPPPAAGPAAPGKPAAAPATPAAAAMATNQPAATASATPAPPVPAKPRVVAQPRAVINGNTGQETRESAAARPQPPPVQPALRPASPSGGAPPSGADEPTSALRIAAIVGGAVACVLVAGLIVMLMGGDDLAPKRPNEIGTVPAVPADPGTSSSTSAASPVDRGATTTTVLNATTTAGLARNVSNKLESAGFTIEEVGDNVDQTLPETAVYYSDGNQRAAAVVARTIGVSKSVVQPVDGNADVARAGARVVVTVGADLIE